MRPATKQTEYHLEIYEPGSIDDVARVFLSPAPFMTFSEGDLINSAFFPDENPGHRLRVVKVEHIVWDSDDHNAHKLCVYTEEIDEGEAFSWHS